MHLSAAAEMTPSGVPPMPHSRSTGERSLTASSAAETSPSRIRRMRAPASRTCFIASSWRGPVEHDDGHVADAHALALGDQPERLRQRAVEREQVGDLLAAGDLLHVDAWARVEHRAALGERDHGERARHPERGQARALERVDGDVDARRRAVADLLAVVEHRRLVLLALADHDERRPSGPTRARSASRRRRPGRPPPCRRGRPCGRPRARRPPSRARARAPGCGRGGCGRVMRARTLPASAAG